jgi:hypothetical protein
MLFHVSETPGISQFEPRVSDYTDRPVVWAISADKLRNYLLPRDCPRVTFVAAPGSTKEDIARFLPEGRPVVAIEAGWLKRVDAARLYLYCFRKAGFSLLDDTAGYFVSHTAVRPEAVEIVDDLPQALKTKGVDLRILPDLWALHDEIRASSLGFSLIRMRNATPRLITRR